MFILHVFPTFLNPFYLSVQFHIENRHFFGRGNQMTGFYMKRNSRLKWVKYALHARAYIHLYTKLQLAIRDPWHVKVLKFCSTETSAIYDIKIMCTTVYHHNGFVVTHTFSHMMHGCASNNNVHELPQNHCDDNREAISSLYVVFTTILNFYFIYYVIGW